MQLKSRAILLNSAFVLTFGFAAYAQAPALITQPIDDHQLFTLAGNTRPEASDENDLGRVPDNTPIDHVLMQLQRSPQQEEAVQKLIDQLHDPKSPNYHQWLTAAQFGQRFGLSQQDLNVISGWLKSHGLTVNTIYPNGMLIDFSGTAAQIREAFHTEIHNLSVGGAPHIANMRDPQIPAALAPAVAGIVSLHNFWPHPMYNLKADYTFSSANCGGTCYAVGPGDLAVIYNLTPLQKAGKTGQGQTVVVVEDSNMKAADFTSFRTTFGLSRFTSGKLVTVHPPSTGTNNCSNPGNNGDSLEATLDAEYASSAAPSATIEMATCGDTATTFGGLIAIENLLNASATPPGVMSMSYGECETLNGAAANATFNSAFQQAVTLGVSIFVSSGDDGAAACDRTGLGATHGIGITGWGGTPYNVAVGGTDFGDTYAGSNATYWNATNTQFFESAKSYIPEIPWNDSCAGVLASTFEGFPTPYGSAGFCNSSAGQNFRDTVAASGGPSGCATGIPSIPEVVSGTCKGYARPSWQAGVVGLPNNTVRNIPDVSLFAANGVWGHYYPICYSITTFGGVPCTGAPSNWPGAGGTSFSSPIMAGIQALVNQQNGGRQGNPNVVYYKLAAAEYGASGSPSCNSTLGNTAASTCTFYDVTLGDMDLDCTGTHACYLPSGTYGVLSTAGNQAYVPAFNTTTGWDFATGIGTVNAANLVKNWKSVAP